jgi:hypothetical protein
MALPFAAALLGSGGAQILDYALGRPMNLWGRSVDAVQAPGVRSTQYRGNRTDPNVLPAPDAIIEAYRRGMIDLSGARWGLESQGVAWNLAALPPPGQPADPSVWYTELWEQVGKMRRSRPDPLTWANLWVRGRISDQSYGQRKVGYDADWNAFERAAYLQYQTPGLSDALQLFRLGKIQQADYDQVARQLGWYNTNYLRLQESVTPLPDLFSLMRLHKIGALRPGDYGKYATALGHTDDYTRSLIESTFYQVPGPAALVNFAVREVWDEQTVQRWGYDSEFPEPLRHWLDVQGYDWGRSFTGQDGQRYPSLHWPKAFWRAHWQVISPGQAYQAFRRLRPERLNRYAQLFPGIAPFTLQDLQTVLKVHDYPPMARSWLAALNSQPLRMYTVRTAFNLGVRSREWALEQLTDLGYVRDDALAIVETIEEQKRLKDTAGIRRLQEALPAATAKEVLAGYGDGLVPRDTAIERLRAVGFDSGAALQALDLAESRFLRQSARQVVSQVRRSYLSGTLSAPQAVAALAAIQLADPRRSQLVQRWTVQLSLEQRQLSTGQVATAVATGALAPAAAIARLSNLHWSLPDAALLTAQAEARYLQAKARAARSAAAQAQARERALLAAQRQAAAAQRQAQIALRRITPPARLKRLYCLGIRKAPWIQARLLSIGYDTTSALDQLREWNDECVAAPPLETPAVKGIQALLRRQTPRGTVKEMFQNGVVTEQWARRRLNDLGFTPESIDYSVSLWYATLGKKPGPKAAG